MDFSATDEKTDSFPSSAVQSISDEGVLHDRNRALKVMIAAAARGDADAFEALYDSSASWLLGRIRRITGESLAEDVLAEVYLQVWRSLPVYNEGRGEPLAWLATIARSRALDRLRIERRSHGGLLEAPTGLQVDESHDAGPEELMAEAERASLLRISMGALSARERLVLGMAYFRDCTLSEIAALTGLPLGSVKTLMTRSKQKLRVSLSARLGPGPLHDNDGLCQQPLIHERLAPLPVERHA